jgi:hypothetical protein
MVPAMCCHGVLAEVDITQYASYLTEDVEITQYVSYLTTLAGICSFHAPADDMISRICVCDLDLYCVKS